MVAKIRRLSDLRLHSSRLHASRFHGFFHASRLHASRLHAKKSPLPLFKKEGFKIVEMFNLSPFVKGN